MALSMKKEKHSLRNKITEWSEVPKDVAMGMPVLTVTHFAQCRYSFSLGS